jgi:phage gp36-like protein
MLQIDDTQAQGAVVRVKITGGTAGEAYLIKLVALNAGAPVEGELEVHVLELGFVLPDGTQAYCTPRAYVARFGYEETLRFTDERGLGRIDGDRLGAALVDAMAMVDGYLAGVYAVPVLPPIPPLIATFSAMIARGMLAMHEVDEHPARKNMALALKQLADVATGKIQLVGATRGDAVEETATPANEVISTGGDRIFSDDSLKGF